MSDPRWNTNACGCVWMPDGASVWMEALCPTAEDLFIAGLRIDLLTHLHEPGEVWTVSHVKAQVAS